MILDVYREGFHPRIKARSLGHGPAFQDTIKFQPEIIVEMAGIVLLDETPARRFSGEWPDGSSVRENLSCGDTLSDSWLNRPSN